MLYSPPILTAPILYTAARVLIVWLSVFASQEDLGAISAAARTESLFIE